MLLERADELEVVSAALRAARRGKGSLLVISGPLGSGKSELLRVVAATAGAGSQETGESQGVTVFTARACALEVDYGFGVARQLLEPTFFAASVATQERWLSGCAAPAEAVFAPGIIGSGADHPVAAGQQVPVGLRTLAERMSDGRTLVILVDDLHWVDEPSLRWLALLTSRLHQLPVLVVVTVREADPPANRPAARSVIRAADRVLRPRPFSLAGTRDFVASVSGEAGDEEFVRACHEATAGNPMFLRSVLLSLSVNGVPPRAEQAGKIRSLWPAQLRSRLIDYLGAQPAPVRDVAKAIAILGDQADPEIIERFAGLDAVGCAEALRVVQQLGLLAATTPRPRFTDLVRDAVEQSMTIAERERLHVRAVRLLHDSGYTAEQVAAQLLAVAAPQGWWATEVLRTAAAAALRQGTPETASRYLRRALFDASPDGADRARVLVDLATAERAFDVRASVRHIGHALPLLGSARERACAIVRLSPAALGDVSPLFRGLIRQVFDELADPAGAAGPDQELRLHVEARMRYLDDADPAELADAIRRLDQLGDEPPVDTPAERELLAILLAAATLTTRRPASAVGSLALRILAREPALASHVHTAMPALMTVLAATESTESVTRWLDTSLDHARQHGAVIEQALIRSEQAVVFLHEGRTADARHAAADAFDLVEPGTAGSTTVIAMAAVASATMDVGLTRKVLANCDTQNAGPCLTSVLHLMRGTLARAGGDLHAALEHYRECGRQLARSGWRNPVLHPWRAATADLYRRLGKVDRAHEVAEEDCARAAEWGAPSALGRAKRLLGQTVPGEPGIAALRESVDILEGSVNRLELARSLLRLGNRLQERGDRDAAGHLRRCHQIALDCGNRHLAGRARAVLDAADTGAPRPTLTKTELRVARLAAAGHTNHDIARFLRVSQRAVEKHLTSSYRKLGVRGRVELADVLPSTGPGATFARPA